MPTVGNNNIANCPVPLSQDWRPVHLEWLEGDSFTEQKILDICNAHPGICTEDLVSMTTSHLCPLLINLKTEYFLASAPPAGGQSVPYLSNTLSSASIMFFVHIARIAAIKFRLSQARISMPCSALQSFILSLLPLLVVLLGWWIFPKLGSSRLPLFQISASFPFFWWVEAFFAAKYVLGWLRIRNFRLASVALASCWIASL
jgi:hypothetical protein